MNRRRERALIKKYGYAWITLGLFLFSLAGHWIFGWYAYLNEQHGQHLPVETSEYLVVMMRDTMENWQSEFLQLLWQVGGLALFLYYGSPQSKEDGNRKEAKIDAILRHLDAKNGDVLIKKINQEYANGKK